MGCRIDTVRRTGFLLVSLKTVYSTFETYSSLVDLQGVKDVLEKQSPVNQKSHLWSKGTAKGLSMFKPMGFKELSKWINLCSLISKTLGLQKSRRETL